MFSFENMIVNKQVNYLFQKIDTFVRKYYVFVRIYNYFKKINYLFENMITPFGNEIYFKRINYLIRKYDFVDRHI